MYHLNNLTFKKVCHNNLIVNKKYMIVEMGRSKDTYIKGYFQNRYNYDYLIFGHLKSKTYGPRIFFTRWDVYELISMSQLNMEQRAINRVLQKITGDSTFTF